MMKKVLFGLSAILALFATSCQNELDQAVATGDTSTITFEVSIPELATRAYSDGKTAKVLHYAVFDVYQDYNKEGNPEVVEYIEAQKPAEWPKFENNELTKEIKLQLVTGNSYKVVFWAAAEEKEGVPAPYTFDPATAKVTVNYGDAAKCNDEARDAFFGNTAFVLNGNQSVGVELTRPFAQLNIGTNDYLIAENANVVPLQSKVTVESIANELNLFTGEVEGEETVTFEYAPIPYTNDGNDDNDENFPVAGYEYIAMNYLLVDGPTVVDVQFTCKDEQKREYTRVVGSVPVKGNFRTNIYGQILTSTADLDVEIKPGYNPSDSEVYPVVVDAAGLQKALNEATSGVTTISLARDIEGDVVDFQRADRDIVIDGGNNKFNGTIRIHNGSSYNNGTITIKNVNFETSTASINFIEALENGSERYSNNITVENCTFTATGDAVKTAVAVQVKATRGVTVTGCTATNMHSLIQAQSCDTGDVKVIDCTVNGKNGVAFKQVKSATVENTEITAREYGIRFDGNIANYGITVKNNNVTAKQPIIVRKMTGANNTIALVGNTLTTTENYQVVITKGSDDEAYDKPTGTYTLTGADEYYVYPRDVFASSSNDLQASLAEGVSVVNLNNGEYQLTNNLGNAQTEISLIGNGIENTIVKGASSSNTNNPGVYAHGKHLVFKNLTYETPNNGYQGGFGHAASVTFINCKIIGQYYAHSGAPHTFIDCVIDPLTGYLYTYGSDCVFEGCTFKSSEGKALQVYEDASTGENKVSIKNCTFEAAKQATTYDGKPVTAIDINSNGAIFNVTVEKCTATGYPVGLNSGSNMWNIKNNAQNVNLTIDGELKSLKGFGIVKGYYAQGNTYTVLNGEGFKTVATKILTDASQNVVVELANDIDLAGIEWPAVATNATFVLDGKGYSIKNLTTSAVEDHGFYSTAMFTSTRKAATIKNLVVENATVTGKGGDNSHGAVLVACNYAALSISGVTVKGSTISNCDRTGGLVTYLYFTDAKVENCVVDGCTINSIGTAGAILGMNNNHNFTMKECTVTNTTVSSSEGSNKAGILIGTWQQGGTLTNEGNTFTGSKAINAGTETNNEIGRNA